MIVLAIDPGRGKCGIAVVGRESGIIYRAIIERREIIVRTVEITRRYMPTDVIVGRGTGGVRLAGEIGKAVSGVTPVLVDEKFTTLDARKRYFIENPPRGLKRLIPRGLLVPEVNVDDYAAIILAERFLRDSAPEQL